MAESGPREDILSCSLCLGDFNDPRALPCLHTFCLQCLIQLDEATKGKASLLTCPICREIHELPENGAQGFRQDFRIKNFVDIVGKNKFQLQSVKCPKHPTLEVLYICKDKTCGQAELCSQCRSEKHLDHNVTSVKEQHENMVNKLCDSRKAIQGTTEILDSISGHLEKNRFDLLGKLAKKVKAHLDALSCLEKKTTSDINRVTNEQLLKISQHKEALAFASSKLESLGSEQLRDSFVSIAKKMPQIESDFANVYRYLDGLSFKYLIPDLETETDNILDSTFFDVKMRAVSVNSTKATSAGISNEKVTATDVGRWEHGCKSTLGLVCHDIGGEGGVTVVSGSQIKVCEQSTGNVLYSEYHRCHDIGDVTVFGNHLYAVADRVSNRINIYDCWSIHLEQPQRTIKVRGSVSWSISGTNNYLVYGSTKASGNVCIVCYSTENQNLKFKWRMNLDWSQERSLNAMESENQLIVLVANFCTDGRPLKRDDALVAVDGVNQLWSITYQELDREANRFDLIDMSNDGRFFYVLNTGVGCIYLLSVKGSVLSKVLQNLVMPVRFSINRNLKTMLVACNRTEMTVYKLTYE